MPADIECPATPPELPREPTPTRVKLSPSRNGSGSPGRASPDSACPICLGKLDNKAFSDSCMHKFCFTCILEWSKVRAVCPLCKQVFSSIIHNVRSELDYDRYMLPPPRPSPAASPDLQNPYFFHPGDGAESRSRWPQMHRQRYRYRSLVLPILLSFQDGHDYHLPAAARPRSRAPPSSRVTSASRHRLYASDMWARPTADELTGRFRETGPDFYRNNPACTHRLVPWLNRELNAVLDSPSHLAHVMEHIMELINRLHILSPEFRQHLEPYLNPWTEHFVHEFYCYARSPYDMVGYDLHVQYEAHRPRSPPAQVMASSSESDSDNDSDIRVLTPPPRPATPILIEPESPGSPEPGPSGSGGSVVGRGLCATLSRVRAFLGSARADAESNTDDSDSTVEVVEVLPPRHERPPVIVTLSSDEESSPPPPLPPPPPPPPPPQAAERAEAERRRAGRRERRAAARAAQRGEKRRHTAEKRTRSDDRSGKRRRRDRSTGMGDVAGGTAQGRQHRDSSRVGEKADKGERRRSKRTEEERADSKSSQSRSNSRASEAGVSSSSSQRSSKWKSTAALSATSSASSSRSSEASWNPSNGEGGSASSSLSSTSSDIAASDAVTETTERSSCSSSSSCRSAMSAMLVRTMDTRSSKPSDKFNDRSHKSKSSDRNHKSKSSYQRHKSGSYDRGHKSKSRDKDHKSKHRDKSKSKLDVRHHSSRTSSGKSGHEEHTSAERRHRRRAGDESRSRHRRRSRLESNSSEVLYPSPWSPASPGSPQPSTSSGVTADSRLFHRIVLASSSPREAVSSSSSSVGAAPARAARCRRLSDSEGSSEPGRPSPTAVASDSDGQIGRRPAVRSAVVRARRAALSDDSDSSDW